MKVRFVTKQLKSGSLKELAKELTKQLGYKVFRSTSPRAHRLNVVYGDCKGKIEQYSFFQNSELPALEFTTDSNVAYGWWLDGEVVVGRKLTHSSEGKGIVVAETAIQLVQAPVYTKYKKKKKEFRVHIFKDQVVHVLEKRKKKDYQGESEAKIRNLANGYVFCSDGVVEPDGLRDLALRAAKVTASDFKGVDIGYNEKKNELFVIEVNSAPGIQGSNIACYVDAIKSYI